MKGRIWIAQLSIRAGARELCLNAAPLQAREFAAAVESSR
jgi:hypothetical protein